MYDEDGCPVDPDDAWMHDRLYDAWGEPFDDPDDEILPGGYTRGEYKAYGATDGDIEYWGLDQPGAPDPPSAGWVVWEMADEMDRGDGCGLALAVGILSWLLVGLAALVGLGRWVG
jgi:hypothetical protein